MMFMCDKLQNIIQSNVATASSLSANRSTYFIAVAMTPNNWSKGPWLWPTLCSSIEVDRKRLRAVRVERYPKVVTFLFSLTVLSQNAMRFPGSVFPAWWNFSATYSSDLPAHSTVSDASAALLGSTRNKYNPTWWHHTACSFRRGLWYLAISWLITWCCNLGRHHFAWSIPSLPTVIE